MEKMHLKMEQKENSYSFFPENIDNILESSEFEIVKEYKPYRYIVTIKNPEITKGVFKDYTLNIGCAYREKAAYLVDQFFDFGLVNPVTIRDVGNKKGILTPFIEGCVPFSEERFKDPNFEQSVFEIGAFDFLIGEIGRDNLSNVLLKNNRVLLIDHEFSFFKPPFTEFQREIFEKPFPGEFREKIIKFYKNKEQIKILKKQLSKLIEKRYVKDFFKRLEILAKCAENNQFLSEQDYRKVMDKYDKYKRFDKEV